VFIFALNEYENQLQYVFGKPANMLKAKYVSLQYSAPCL